MSSFKSSKTFVNKLQDSIYDIDIWNIIINKKLNINITDEAIKDIKKEIINMKNMKNAKIEYIMR